MKAENKITIKNRNIEIMYRSAGLNIEETYEKTQEALERYRIALWVESIMSSKNENNHNEMPLYCAEDLRQSISGWDDIVQQEIIEKKDKAKSEKNILGLYLEEGLGKNIDKALDEVFNFPEYGKMYYAIIYHLYIVMEIKTKEEIMDRLGISGDTMYSYRKKEAILLLGYCMSTQ